MNGQARRFGRSTLRLMMGDITKVPVDAMANAANSALRGGGGVDGAIHRAGGPAIMHDLDAVRPKGGLPTGQAVATTAGALPARFVFHAVGPVWHDGGQGEPAALASCYRACLRLGEERHVRSLSFPSISTGIYGYPAEQAAEVAVGAVASYLEEQEGATSIEEVVFVLFDEATLTAYARALGERSSVK
ncbi:MAG TPA: O-acetyl-ADP-ribose deacetylase [Solibacterales bacterium]|nr:O-acetyl-ADP-ribose deacetylase [Bryobacterales bacterium]